MKRTSEEAFGGGGKRQRSSVKSHALHVKQPGWVFAHACPQEPEVFDSRLERSLALMLAAAGFDAVKPEALESLRALTEEYMTHFALHVKLAMQSSRRSKPQPVDFARVLARFGLSPSELKRDLKHGIPSEYLQDAILPPYKAIPPEEFLSSFGADLDKDPDRAPTPTRWVPQHFPQFPAEHSFKDTPVVTERESDARKVRESATKEGMQAEQALRKLMVARQNGSRTVVRDPKRSDRDRMEIQATDLFKEAMKSMIQQDTAEEEKERADAMLSDEDPGMKPKESLAPTSVDFGATVNYDKMHWRKSRAGTGFF